MEVVVTTYKRLFLIRKLYTSLEVSGEYSICLYQQIVRCQDPRAPGALLEPPNSPDRNLIGTWQEPSGTARRPLCDPYTRVPDRTLSGT
jgi:hypothetical protein